MSKKLIATAVGAALALSPLAATAAKVTVYGIAQVEIANYDLGNPTSTDGNAVQDNSMGRFGITASEKLGNGMTAMAKFEFLLDTADNSIPTGATGGASTTGGRESWVGLKGSFGTVALGRIKAAYKNMGGVKYDPFTATALQSRGNGGMTTSVLGNSAYGHGGFLSNSIGWYSNNMNGVNIIATYSPDEVAGNGSGNDGDYSLGVQYTNGPMQVGVAFIKNKEANSAGGDGWKIFGSYKFGNHKIVAQLEKTDDNDANNDGTGGDNVDVDTWFIGWQMTSGNNTFVAQMGKTETGPTAERDYYAIGIIHNMSKKTRIFGGFRSTDDTNNNNDSDVFSVGLRMVF